MHANENHPLDVHDRLGTDGKREVRDVHRRSAAMIERARKRLSKTPRKVFTAGRWQRSRSTVLTVARRLSSRSASGRPRTPRQPTFGRYFTKGPDRHPPRLPGGGTSCWRSSRRGRSQVGCNDRPDHRLPHNKSIDYEGATLSGLSGFGRTRPLDRQAPALVVKVQRLADWNGRSTQLAVVHRRPYERTVSGPLLPFPVGPRTEESARTDRS